MHFLSADQIRSLADAIDPRFRALILMAGFTGLRWGELVGLRAEHLDLLRGTVDVRQALTEAGSGVIRIVPTKTGQRRTVPLPRFLCKTAYRATRAVPRTQRAGVLLDRGRRDSTQQLLHAPLQACIAKGRLGPEDAVP